MKKENKQNNKRKNIITLSILGGIVILFMVAFLVISGIGKWNLYSAGNGREVIEAVDITELSADELGDVLWRNGDIIYQDEVYKYNEDILTFLVMGIDKEGELEATDEVAAGGQSDALFFVIMNPTTESISVIAIDRNYMTDILLPGLREDGADKYVTAQIALQYGFGDGRESSCELTKQTVCEAFYNIPVNGYLAVGYSALPQLNDAVGGVEVTVTEDVIGDTGWTVGDKVLLRSEEAILYLRYRDTTLFESARLRTIRQKEYMQAFVDKAIAQTKEDITTPIQLYNSIKDYIVTDISADEIMYLAEQLPGYTFNMEQIYTTPGETVMGEKYEEFYPDHEEIKQMLIDLYYIKEE